MLEHYMQAWLPIMTSWSGRVLFIDAFAGPGEYSSGEPGSPVIALRSLIEHRYLNKISGQVYFLFIEKEEDRSRHLKQVLRAYDSKLPKGCDYDVINSTFDETLTDVLQYIEDQRSSLAPAFVMIDPFGVSETPMKTVARILGNPQSEVYISFMYEWINRFKGHPNFERHLDNLFGCPDWRNGLDLAGSDRTRKFFCNLYKSQLKNNGAKYVLHIDMYKGNRHVYTIFFGTNHLDGCDKMKKAMWKVNPFGDSQFRSGRVGQLTLGLEAIDFSPLERDLRRHFRSKGWQRIEKVEDFVKSDATDFHLGHLRTKTLKPMEADGKIEVDPSTRRRSRTYPKGTVLRFL